MTQRKKEAKLPHYDNRTPADRAALDEAVWRALAGSPAPLRVGEIAAALGLAAYAQREERMLRAACARLVGAAPPRAVRSGTRAGTRYAAHGTTQAVVRAAVLEGALGARVLRGTVVTARPDPETPGAWVVVLAHGPTIHGVSRRQIELIAGAPS